VRFRLTLAYDGTDFAGWQRQPNAPTVQQELEEAIGRLAGEVPRTTGAGRTDAGVHAAGQVVSFELARELPPRALVHGVNRELPPAIRVLDAAAAPPGFDARRHATAKLYRYRLDRSAVVPPGRARFVAPAEGSLALDALTAAAAALVGRHDFSAFALAGGAATTTVRTIRAAAWEEHGPELRFRIAGDGFLRGMVRSLVGTLVEVGVGRRGVDEFVALLAGGERAAAGATAPARGLCLERVDYR